MDAAVATGRRMDAAATGEPLARPRSAVPLSTGMVGLLGLVASVLWVAGTDLPADRRALACLAATAMPMVLWAVLVEKVYRNPSTGLDFATPRPFAECLSDTVTKLIGLWGTWIAIGVAYWALRWYTGPVHLWYFLLLAVVGPAAFLLSIPYVLLVDRYMVHPRDGLWHMGKWFAGDWRSVDRTELHDHLRCWAIKAFFLAFMAGIVPGSVAAVTMRPMEAVFADTASFALWAIQALFLVDVCFGTVGYVVTFRVLDSHVRSANPHLSAWVAALACYPPFALMAANGPLAYRTHGQEWTAWLQGSDVLLVLWAAALLALTALYAWATMAFGLRFSNLTHRGILTGGPYRWFRHPAYLSKNLFWWLAYMPFLSTAGPGEAVRNCLLLLSVNAIYFLRARTEERHLMADPRYRAYSAWIGARGVIPRTLRRLGSYGR